LIFIIILQTCDFFTKNT